MSYGEFGERKKQEDEMFDKINSVEKILEDKFKIEKDKRVFPISDDADEVLVALNKCLIDNKVKIAFCQ